MNQRTRRLIVVVLSAVLAGCATLQDVVNSKDKGTSETYAVSMDQAKEIAETVLRWDDASTVIHKSSEGNFMYARVSNWLGSFGNRDWVGIWFDRLKPDETKVTVVTKRYNQLAAAIALTETTFHKRFAEAVQIVKEGKPLPIAPPVPEPVTSESPLESP